MKHSRVIFFLMVLMLVLTVGSGCSTKQAELKQAEWKVVVPQKLFAEKLRIAAFHNEDFGFNGGAGDIGKARFTLDGGKSWIQADSSGG